MRSQGRPTDCGTAMHRQAKTCRTGSTPFLALLQAVKTCTLCSTMGGRGGILHVLGRRARRAVMFVGEAPGRRGAVRTGIPFQGDSTGHNFEILLESAGWSRRDVWVTNAVLCWPGSRTGTNRKPHALEISNCQAHLRNQIEIVQPVVVVPLGASALRALDSICPARFAELKTAVAQPQSWNGRYLFPLYHPSPRVTNTRRSLEQQRADFSLLRAFVLGKTATGRGRVRP